MEIIDERDDFYFRLGVKRNATTDEIRRAYYKLARHCHPDKISKRNSVQLKEKFSLIHEAYSTLIDVNSRKVYDLKLAETGPPCWSGSDEEKEDEDAFDHETIENILSQWDISVSKHKKDTDDREIWRIINLSRQSKPNLNRFHNRCPSKSDTLLKKNKTVQNVTLSSVVMEDATKREESLEKSRKTHLMHQQYHRPKSHPNLIRATSEKSQLPDCKFFKKSETSKESFCEKCSKPFAEIKSHRRVCNELSTQSETKFSDITEHMVSDFTNYTKTTDDYEKVRRRSKATGQYMSPDSAPCPFCRVKINKSYFGNHISSCMLSKHSIKRPTSAIGGLSRTDVAKEYAKTVPRPRRKILDFQPYQY